MKMHTNPSRRRSDARLPQRGVVMLFGLFALAIMMIAAAAMIRSYGTAMTNAGNLGFKRDLTNQAERAVAAVVTSLQTGSLATETARQADNVAQNYSSTLLSSNAQGLPDALVTDSAFTTRGVASNDIAVTDQAVTMRYLVDRMCANTGAASADQCTLADDLTPISGQGGGETTAEVASTGGSGAVGKRVVYRISIRMTGPRSTQAFFQTTVTL